MSPAAWFADLMKRFAFHIRSGNYEAAYIVIREQRHLPKVRLP